jgi:IclR family transcriptional regulator, KDG regulon repressor
MSTPKETNGVQAVLFALQIMEHVATQNEAIGVTTLAEHFQTNKSKIFRHLKTLAQQGYIVQDEASERYRIGARLIALGHAISDNVDVVREARVVMRKVRNALNHSVVLSLLDRGGVRVVTVESGTSAVEITVKPGSLMDYHSSAQGKVALAFGAETLRKQVLDGVLPAHTPSTLTDPGALGRELERIRKQGWGMAPNEAVTGLNALAAPIFDASGALVGTVAIVDSVQFIGNKPTKLHIETMVAAGQSISESIGFKTRRVGT